MVKVREDLTGRIFTRLKVLRQAEDAVDPKSGQHYARWLCECSCEEHNLVVVRGDALKSGHTLSCGCYNKEIISKANKKYNRYDLSGEYGVGWASNTNNPFYFDLEDYDKIKDYCWHESILNNGYHALCTHVKNDIVRMHWLLTEKYYDHINRNPLDNRRANLRKATQKENMQNRSKHKNNTSGIMGVNWRKDRNKWRAFISVDNKQIFLGYFADKKDAIKTRLKAELKYYGEFSSQQYLCKEYGIDIEEVLYNE